MVLKYRDPFKLHMMDLLLREIHEITFVQMDQVIEGGEIFQNLLQVCIVGVLLSEIGLRNSDERYQSKSKKGYK